MRNPQLTISSFQPWNRKHVKRWYILPEPQSDKWDSRTSGEDLKNGSISATHESRLRDSTTTMMSTSPLPILAPPTCRSPDGCGYQRRYLPRQTDGDGDVGWLRAALR
ncbi:hypothetical protein M404DRAFT_1003120 [Pisolithus tinctorius Marx 270]|uniref:Uncharacterized protein n=1 Tax=Pisolithus tinctorius Marx 270 TaxID=870435 RepID=A0A0C3IX81_PISTI|nr:hypothetical protein M404DRAFT_1003120 [Pisolithus tinctorius Marx 270]